MATVQSIFSHLHKNDLINIKRYNSKQKKVIRDIKKCRTIDNGFHSDTCENCGSTSIHYNSCKNASCPQCQAVNREVWILKQKYYTLNIRYFHTVFTLPSELNCLALIDPKIIYSILFKAASETLKELSKDTKYLGAKIGFTAVLHTWGQNLSLHPHLHVIVSGGGVDEMGKWKNSKKKFFIPVKVMSKVFRGKYLSLLKKEFNVNKLDDPNQLKSIIDDCYKKDWVVYTKKPMKNPSRVIEYLGRYTHRIAISNSRILSHQNGKVTFKYKDYKDKSRNKEMTLDEKEFLRRFMLHVLPQGFVKIKHYGFLGNRNKEDRIKTLRTITNTPKPEKLDIDYEKIISSIIKKDVSICKVCGQRRHHKLE